MHGIMPTRAFNPEMRLISDCERPGPYCVNVGPDPAVPCTAAPNAMQLCHVEVVLASPEGVLSALLKPGYGMASALAARTAHLSRC